MMNKTFLKTISIIALSAILGYLTSQTIDAHREKLTLQNTASGLFIIKGGRIYELFELANKNTPDFRDSYKEESKRK